jgi:hypothetical protein
MAVIWGIEIFGPLIEAHDEGGHIVSTASIAGLIPGANPAYDVSKYGVVALSERPFRNSLSGMQFVEQRLGFLQIAHVEAFGEPAIDRSEQLASLLGFALVAPEPREAHCCA